MSAPTVASQLPPKVRAWVYALLGLSVPVLFAADQIYELGPWVALVGIATTSGGFGLALANTSKPAAEDEASYTDATSIQELAVLFEDDDDTSEAVGVGFGSTLRR
jgi:hypothetical protein